MNKRAHFVIAAMLSLAAFVAGSAPAADTLHLKLDKSAPEADQVLTAAPEKIVLEFSQKPELAVSRIVVTGGEGPAKLTDVARSEDDETILWAAFEEPLTTGAYTVRWMTSSGDGHPIRGEFAFTVRADR